MSDFTTPHRAHSRVRPAYFAAYYTHGSINAADPREAPKRPMEREVSEHRGWSLVYSYFDHAYYGISETGNTVYFGKYATDKEAAAMFPEWLHSYRGVER